MILCILRRQIDLGKVVNENKQNFLKYRILAKKRGEIYVHVFLSNRVPFIDMSLQTFCI